MPILYIVATPIGNLEDVTLRALRILKEVGLIAAEDTRKTRHLLTRYGIKTHLTSYNDHNKKTKLNYLLNQLEEKDIALVSEAGMPGLSDPGYDLVVAAAEQGIPVVPVPGSSAVITALVASGLPTRQFTYVGFLPRKKGERVRLMASIAREPRTIVCFESPHRLLQTLSDIKEVAGDRKIAVAREMTKIHEEIFRGTISEAIEHFREPRGEFTLIIAGNTEQESVTLTPKIENDLARLYRQGFSTKEAVAQISLSSGLPKKEVYKAWLKIKDTDSKTD